MVIKEDTDFDHYKSVLEKIKQEEYQYNPDIVIFIITDILELIMDKSNHHKEECKELANNAKQLLTMCWPHPNNSEEDIEFIKFFIVRFENLIKN